MLKQASLVQQKAHKVHATVTFLLSESYYTVRFHYKCQRFSLQENQLVLNRVKSLVKMWKIFSKCFFKETNHVWWENIIFQDAIISCTQIIT